MFISKCWGKMKSDFFLTKCSLTELTGLTKSDLILWLTFFIGRAVKIYRPKDLTKHTQSDKIKHIKILCIGKVVFKLTGF